MSRTRLQFTLCLLSLAGFAFLLGCEEETAVQKPPAPAPLQPSPTPTAAAASPTATSVPSPTPTRTLSPEEQKYGRKEQGPRPTPVPLQVNGFGTDPPVLYARGGTNRGQLVVFLGSIVYEKVGPDNVSLELAGKSAEGIAVKGVELFEAQDLLVNFQLSPETPPGQYDARIRVGGKEFLLRGVFEVRPSP